MKFEALGNTESVLNLANTEMLTNVTFGAFSFLRKLLLSTDLAFEQTWSPPDRRFFMFTPL